MTTMDDLKSGETDRQTLRMAYTIEALSFKRWKEAECENRLREDVAAALSTAPAFIREVADTLMDDIPLSRLVQAIKDRTGVSSAKVYRDIVQAKVRMREDCLSQWKPIPVLPSNRKLPFPLSDAWKESLYNQLGSLRATAEQVVRYALIGASESSCAKLVSAKVTDLRAMWVNRVRPPDEKP